MNTSGIKTRFISLPIAIVSVAFVYIMTAKISFLFTIPPGNITPIFPAAGLALAAVMIVGRSALIGVWLGSFAVNTISFFDGSLSSAQAGLPSLLAGAFIGLGAMSGAAVGAFLVQRFCNKEYPLQSGRNVLILVTVGALGCSLISPTFGVLSLSLGGNISWERFGYSWITWWGGDAAGTLVAAPLILAWQHRHPFQKNFWRIQEAGVLGGATLFACLVVFFRNTPCEYVLLPILLWAAFRFGMRGVTTSAAVIALLATIGTSRGSSPFVGGTTNESLLLLNSFLGVTITCALFLAGMMEEQRRTDEKLLKLNRALRAVGECNQALIHATDEGALLNRVCRLVTDIGGYRLAWVGLAEQDKAKTVRPVAQAGFEEGYLETMQITWADTGRGRGPTGIAIRTGRPCMANAILTNPDFAPWRAEALKRGYESSLVLPLKTGDLVVGALNIYSVKPDSFDAEETKLLSELADDLMYGITALRISTQQKQAETALRVSEQQYRELVMLANSIILRWSPEGRVTFLNEFGQRFFGYTAREIIGRHVVGTLVPEIESKGRDLRPLIEEIRADPKKFERNINENMCRNGERVWIDWTNKVVLDEQGKIQEILSIGSDITERKQAEEQILKLHDDLRRHADTLEQRVAERTAELAAVNDEQRTIFESASTGIVLLRDRTIIRCNRKLEEISGYASGELVGKSTRIWYLDEEAYVTSGKKVYPQMAKGETYRQEQQMARKDGSLFWARLSLHAFDKNAPVKGAVGIIEDITDEREAADTLREAMEKAQEADRIKSAFLATMSHELRTPLNSIIGFTGIMLQGLAGPLNAEQEKQMTMVQNSSRHLLSLINDVLDISKIEAGQLDLAVALFDVQPSIEKTIKLISPLAVQKGIDVQLIIAEELGSLTTDQRRFEQIVLNLLNNAVKFTEKGHVCLTCRSEDGHIMLSFSDTGIGMRQEELPNLFQPFRQIDAGLARKHEGTGLGLSICKKILDIMGGSIEVESRWGQGSTFNVRIPRQARGAV